MPSIEIPTNHITTASIWSSDAEVFEASVWFGDTEVFTATFPDEGDMTFEEAEEKVMTLFGEKLKGILNA